MGTRQKSKLPIKEVKKSLRSTTSSNTTTKKDKALQDLEQISHKKTIVEKKRYLNKQEPLTPLHRLRKFKLIRDRNLGKTSGRKRLSVGTMSVDVQKEDTEVIKGPKEMKIVQEKCEKITNGNEQNGAKDTNGDECTDVKNTISETNGEVEISLKNDVTEKVEDDLTKQSETPLIDEKAEIVIEEVVTKAVDNEDNPDNKEKEELVKVCSDNDEDSDEESFVELHQEQLTTVLSNFREVSTSQQFSYPSTSQQFNYQQVKTENFEQPSGNQQSSLSPETRRRLKSVRVEGRRGLWQSRTGCRKRKYDANLGGGYNDIEKKQAFECGVTMNSPSVVSPGWKFISSPFTRFWTPQSTSPTRCTPYKSIIADSEDSMAVNFDDKSLFNNLNDPELELSSDSSQSSNSSAWRCQIM